MRVGNCWIPLFFFFDVDLVDILHRWKPLPPPYQPNTILQPPPPTQPTIQNQPAPPAVVPAAKTRPATPFEYLVQVILPNKRVRTGNRKTKVEKTEPFSFGPANMKADIGWDDFTAAVAGLVHVICQPLQLCIGTMEWHWLKPANSPWLPLQNETGLVSMLNKVVASKSSPYIIIRMQPKTLLDRVEVGGEKDEERPLALNDLANGMDAMDSTVIENNDTSILRISVHLWKLESVSKL